MAQQGEPSPRIFLDDPGAPSGAGSSAAVPDVTCIAGSAASVNAPFAPVPDARLNCDLAGRALLGSDAGHTGSMPPADSVVMQLRGRGGRARAGGRSQSRRARLGRGGAAQVGENVPLVRAVVEDAGSVTGVESGADAAIVRPTTSVDAA